MITEGTSMLKGWKSKVCRLLVGGYYEATWHVADYHYGCFGWALPTDSYFDLRISLLVTGGTYQLV